MCTRADRPWLLAQARGYAPVMTIRKTPSIPSAGLHLGVPIPRGRIYGPRISRETYATINKRSTTRIPRKYCTDEYWAYCDQFYDDPEHRFSTDEWCQEHREAALENFDLNMAYFKSLDHDEFEMAVQALLEVHKPLRQYDDLTELKSKKGLYVMILDDYCQAYIGITGADGGIQKRIRQHWTKQKAFDRLLWGGVHTSILSIDSFQALDTTRGLACQSRNPWAVESKLVDVFPRKFGSAASLVDTGSQAAVAACVD